MSEIDDLLASIDDEVCASPRAPGSRDDVGEAETPDEAETTRTVHFIVTDDDLTLAEQIGGGLAHFGRRAWVVDGPPVPADLIATLRPLSVVRGQGTETVCEAYDESAQRLRRIRTARLEQPEAFPSNAFQVFSALNDHVSEVVSDLPKNLPTFSGLNVLIIEPEIDEAIRIASALWDRGIHARPSFDGVVGIKRARVLRPSAIVLCVELNRGSGYTIAYKIKKDPTLHDIPLILTSSSQAADELFDQHKKLKKRADEYLHKPFSVDDLLAKLSQFIEVPGLLGV